MTGSESASAGSIDFKALLKTYEEVQAKHLRRQGQLKQQKRKSTVAAAASRREAE